jgi:hypothetical protein
MTARVQLKKISGLEFQWAWRQDELMGGKPPVKVTFTLKCTNNKYGHKTLRLELAAESHSWMPYVHTGVRMAL